MEFHEAVNWIEEAYTMAYINTRVALSYTEDDGMLLFLFGIRPYLNVFDIALAEMMLVYWVKEQDDEDKQHCWYNGWWMEFMYFFIDIEIATRECKVGTWGTLM